MKVRTRLLLAMGYVGLTVAIALLVPLGTTLERRARTSLENRNLLRATALAQRFGERSFEPEGIADTQTIVSAAAGQFGGRVLVVGRSGDIVADSGGAPLGTAYATSGRPELVQALSGVAWSDIRYSGDLGMDLMATAVPIIEEFEDGRAGARIVGAVRITQSLEEADEAARRTVLGLAAVGGTALLAALGLAWLLANSFARPLRALAETARRFGDGDLMARAGGVGGAAELVDVANSFDVMAGRVERLVRAQREFVADASHQLRTPLTGIKLELEDALAADLPPAALEPLRAAEREVDRLTAITARLLTKASGEGSPRDATADLLDVATRASDRWRGPAERARIDLEVCGELLHVAADAADLDEICDTLVDNALRHGGGPVRIEIERADDRGVLRVRDRGPGIHPEDLSRVTERYARGRGAGAGGTGLGLAIARELVERWEGELEIISGGDGTSAAVSLPLRGAPGGAR